MNILRKVLSNTTAQVASKIITSGTGFFLTILIARSFGITGYSDLAKITALIGIFYLAVDLGANAIFLQLEEQEQRFSHLLSFRLLFALLAFVATCLVAVVLPYNANTTSGYSLVVKLGIILFAFSYFSRAIVYTASAFFQKSLVYGNAARATLVGSVVTVLLIGVSILIHGPILWIVASYLVGGFIESIVALRFINEKVFPLSISSEFTKKIFFSTLPLTLLLIFNLLYFRVDMIILSLLQKSSSVGVYDYAYKFFDFLIALPLFLSNSLYPMLLKQEKNFRIQVKNISLYTLEFFGIGTALVPFVWLLSPLIGFVQKDFISSIFVLQILSLSLPIFFATNILQWIFITKKKLLFLVIVYALSLLVNIILNVIYIPHYSYIAAALITDFSELLVMIAMVIYLFFQ